jgi:hypothetical protein
MTNFLQIFCLVSGTNCSFMKKIHRIPSKFSYVYTIHIVLIKLVLCGKWLRPQSSEPLIHTRISWQSWYPSDSYSVGLGQVQGVAYLKCFLGLGQARWLKLAILATQEVGIRRIMVPGQPWQKSSQDRSQPMSGCSGTCLSSQLCVKAQTVGLLSRLAQAQSRSLSQK